MTEEQTEKPVTEFHHRLAFLGEQTEKFFAELHELWASGKTTEILRVIASRRKHVDVSATAAHETPKHEAGIHAKITQFLAEIRQKVAAGISPTKLSTAPMTA